MLGFLGILRKFAHRFERKIKMKWIVLQWLELKPLVEAPRAFVECPHLNNQDAKYLRGR